MNISFSLTPGEQKLLLERGEKLDEAFRARIRLGIVDGDRLTFEFPQDFFDDFMDNLEYIAATTDDEDIMRILVSLYEQLEEISDAPASWLDQDEADAFIAEEDDEGSAGEDNRSEFMDEVMQALESERPESLEEANAIIRRLGNTFNERPMADHGGLSPRQVHELLNGTPDAPGPPLILHENVPAEMLQSNIMLHNAYACLKLFNELREVKATAKGNLNRKFVAQIRPLLTGYSSCDPKWDSSYKNRNETDLLPLETMRHLLTMSGFLRKTKGHFKLTRKGTAMLAPEKAGTLLASLFRTYFFEFNIAYADHFPPCEPMQYAIPYTLLMLGRHASEWTSIPELIPYILPPFVLAEMPIMPYYDDVAVPLTEIRIIAPLVRFGLLESSDQEDKYCPVNKKSKIRLSPLFNHFIEFNLD